MIEFLDAAVRGHTGEFRCRGICDEQLSKVVPFRHLVKPPNNSVDVPDVPGIIDFYRTFESVILYFDEESKDSAFFVAPPSAWEVLEDQFRRWLDGMGEVELSECTPDWIKSCIVAGSIPRSGNYLLVPISGNDSGKVFEFEHDGFEFFERADSLADFVLRSLEPTSQQLSCMASHLRFVSGEDTDQWWITEMRDNRGNVVLTEA
jgi:hypothetical protein